MAKLTKRIVIINCECFQFSSCAQHIERNPVKKTIARRLELIFLFYLCRPHRQNTLE